MLSLDELAQFLNQYFAVHRFGDDQGGVYRPSTRPIRRIGLALESWTQLSQWASHRHLDALFLHRPWKLEPEQLEPDVGNVKNNKGSSISDRNSNPPEQDEDS